MIIYVFGTLIGYQVLLGTLFPSICESLNIDGDPYIIKIIFMCVACGGVMIPLGLFRDLSALRFISLLSAFTLTYITILVVVEFGFFAQDNDWSEVIYAKIDTNIFSAFSLSLFSFTCHTNVSQIQGEMINSNVRRMSKASRRGMIFLVFPYFLLAFFGYMSTLGDTPSIFIMRNASGIIGNDWLMVIGRILMSITLIFAVPINLPPCRACIQKTIFKIEGRAPFKM
jgi:amino acid permease